ncbi:MAG: tetratricopeptide repeat protein [Thermoanaerobaculia bacterium]|nr:tetratricopeptide repeat protein [Thermoanaerobaculia bacterium]
MMPLVGQVEKGMTEGSIEDVTARLELWCRLTPKGLAFVELHSESARQRVTEALKTKLSERAESFHEISLSPSSTATEIVERLIGELDKLGSGVVSVSGFGPLFPPDKPPAELVSIFNFNRERLAALPLKQIWWMPQHVVEALRAGAPDLYSWFRGRWCLEESQRGAGAWPPDRGFFEMEESLTVEARPESVDDARRRAAYLVRRFEQALVDQETPREQLEKRFLMPAIKALREAGAYAAIRELQWRLHRDASNELLTTLDRASANPIDTAHFGDAEISYRNTLERRINTLGDVHPDTAQALNNLANLYTKQGRHTEAEVLYRRALTILERALGTSHPHVAQALNNLANLYALQSHVAEAQPLYERALRIFEQFLGSAHPYARKVRENLEEMRQAQRSPT